MYLGGEEVRVVDYHRLRWVPTTLLWWQVRQRPLYNVSRSAKFDMSHLYVLSRQHYHARLRVYIYRYRGKP